MNKDLTVGNPSAVLWKFCLPLFGSILFQQLYNIADSFVAGNFVGEDALAAVGNSYEVTLIFIAFAFGCNVGCSVTVSQLFGAKRYNELKTAVYTTLIAGGVLCAALMACGTVFCADLLRIIHTPENVLADSKLYLDIYILGLPFVFFYNISTGIFTALGDSRTPFVFLVCSSLTNIGMDILFVTSFQMGVAGVAWATFLCQGVSCVLAVACVLARLRSIRTEGKVQVFSQRLLVKIAAVAVPSIAQQSFISVGNLIIQGMINSFGSAVMAGYSAAIKLNNLVITSLTALGNGVSNFTAQNLGARKNERIREGFAAARKLAWLLSVPVVLVYVFLGRYLIGAFLDSPSGTAVEVGLEILRIFAPFYFVISVKLIADGVLRGTSSMKKFMISTFTDLVLRVLLAKVFSSLFGSVGIWLAWPVGWTVATVLSVWFYKTGEWNRPSQPEESLPLNEEKRS